MSKITVTIGKVYYGKKDYKELGYNFSPAGTLPDWKKWAKGLQVKLKVSKKKWKMI